MHLLGFHDIFTTKTSMTRVRAVPRYSFSIETLEGLNLMRPTIGIMPSGLSWALKLFRGNRLGSSYVSCHNRSTNFGGCTNTNKSNMNFKTVEKYHEYIYSVPYSDHSCFDEIEDFIKFFQPIVMTGIVSSSPSYVDPLYYFGHLYGGNQESWRHQKFANKDERERLEAVDTKSTFGAKAARKRKIARVDLGVRVGRVRLLRRERCGAKILEVDQNE